MSEPREFRVDIGDVDLSVYEWRGESGRHPGGRHPGGRHPGGRHAGDPVLLLHATGFHSRCWNQVVARLPGQHIYAADLRFHGRSGSLGDVDWSVLSDDIRQLVEQLDLHNIVGVGHSVGGHLIARAAAAIPARFKQLLLIDPVIMSPATYDRFHDSADMLRASDHPVSRRKNRWRDADEIYQRFCDRHPFKLWQPEVLRDYCDYALHPEDLEGYRQLACDPINEASFYVNQAGNEIVHRDLPNISIPVTLLRAERAQLDIDVPDFSKSPTWPELAKLLPCCRDIYLPHMSHFIPMEDPALVARYIDEAQANSWHTLPFP